MLCQKEMKADSSFQHWCHFIYKEILEDFKAPAFRKEYEEWLASGGYERHLEEVAKIKQARR